MKIIFIHIHPIKKCYCSPKTGFFLIAVSQIIANFFEKLNIPAMHITPNLRFFLFTSILIIATSCKKSNSPANEIVQVNPDTVKVRVQSTKELGPLQMPQHLVGRDGGQSVLLSGGTIQWIFGDSFFDRLATDGLQYRTNTATQSTVAMPLETTEPLDANGVSYQFISFTPEEKKFNDSTNDPTNRIALWPTGIVTTGKSNALVFFTKLHIASTWTDFGIGVAHYKSGQSVAIRNADLLFHYPEPNFEKPFIYNGYMYCYGQLRNKLGAGIARAPVAMAEARSAYEFWNGTVWVTDVNAAAAILDVTPGSVSYNPYFKLLIDVYDEPFNNTAFIRFANNPEGPWSSKQMLYNTLPPSSGFNYIINEHSELSKNNGKTIVISYSHPLPSFLAGEIRLAEINFQ